MEPIDIERLEEERPNLWQEVRLRNITELWKLNDTPTGPPAEQVGKRTWILLGRSTTKDYDYLIMSTKGKPDKFYTWLYYGGAYDQQQEAPGAGYIVIDKAKVGRPRRELTGEEVKEIQARRDAGESINKIAAAMHLGTRRVMEGARMTFAQLQHEAVKRGLWLSEDEQGHLLTDLNDNTVILNYEYCTLDAVWDYMRDMEPNGMTDEEAEEAMEKIAERLQE